MYTSLTALDTTRFWLIRYLSIFIPPDYHSIRESVSQGSYFHHGFQPSPRWHWSSARTPYICINYTLEISSPDASHTRLSKQLSRPSYWCSLLHPLCSYSAPRHLLSAQAVAPVRLFIDWEPRRSFIEIQHIKHAWKAFLHLLQEPVLLLIGET